MAIIEVHGSSVPVERPGENLEREPRVTFVWFAGSSLCRPWSGSGTAGAPRSISSVKPQPGIRGERWSARNASARLSIAGWCTRSTGQRPGPSRPSPGQWAEPLEDPDLRYGCSEQPCSGPCFQAQEGLGMKRPFCLSGQQQGRSPDRQVAALTSRGPVTQTCSCRVFDSRGDQRRSAGRTDLRSAISRTSFLTIASAKFRRLSASITNDRGPPMITVR